MDLTHESQYREEIIFDWQGYLDETKTIEVPHCMFTHVEITLQNGIDIDMSIEIEIKESQANNESTYWVATTVMVCGPLLRMRYIGGNDRSLEFWFDLTKESAHELGWCAVNDKILTPPDIVVEKSPDYNEQLTTFLGTAKSIPYEMLKGEGLTIADRIKQGMKIEVSDEQHPYKLWVATIIENVGGRLLLRYDTPEPSGKEFWRFCTCERLHEYGFLKKSNSSWLLEPPSSIKDLHSYEKWKELLEALPKDSSVPDNLFNNQVEHSKHNFKVGMKLEAVLPSTRTCICPATVVKVFDDIYFLIHIDNYDEDAKETLEDIYAYDNSNKNTWLCSADHPYIFPTGWSKKHSIRLKTPQGWQLKEEEFDWDQYLSATKSDAAPKNLFIAHESAEAAGFASGMRLEAVNPQNENMICAAHITKVIDNLLWVKLDNYDEHHPAHIVHMHSKQIFPIGWCGSNHYRLELPRDNMEVCEKVEEPAKDPEICDAIDVPKIENQLPMLGPSCTIYINFQCTVGRMISKIKLAKLPKYIGPGPVLLVMKDLIRRIISVGHRNDTILKLLHSDTEPGHGYQLEVFKAKHKTTAYLGMIPVATSGDMVADFCKGKCRKLMACLNLFSPVLHEECRLCTVRTNKKKSGKRRNVEDTVSSTSKSASCKKKTAN